MNNMLLIIHLDAILVWLSGQVPSEDVPDILFALDCFAPHLTMTKHIFLFKDMIF